MMKPFIRRQYLQETGIVYDEDIKVGEDFGLLFDLLGQGATAYILGKAGYIYTLPFGTKSRQKSTGSRTDYNDKGWQRLIATNDRLLKKVQSGFKDNKPIIGLLLERKLRFTREKAWQEVKQLTAQRKIMPALKLVVRGNLLPHLWERSVNRFKASQAII
jgi:hypothetical protein